MVRRRTRRRRRNRGELDMWRIRKVESEVVGEWERRKRREGEKGRSGEVET